jgi:hypothetical protein
MNILIFFLFYPTGVYMYLYYILLISLFTFCTSPLFALDPNHPQIKAALLNIDNEEQRKTVWDTIEALSEVQKWNEEQSVDVISALGRVPEERRKEISESLLKHPLPLCSDTNYINIIEMLATTSDLETFTAASKNLSKIKLENNQHKTKDACGNTIVNILQDLLFISKDHAKKAMFYILEGLITFKNIDDLERCVKLYTTDTKDPKKVTGALQWARHKLDLHPSNDDSIFHTLDCLCPLSPAHFHGTLVLLKEMERSKWKFQWSPEDFTNFTQAISELNPNDMKHSLTFAINIFNVKALEAKEFKGTTCAHIIRGVSKVPEGKEKEAFRAALNIASIASLHTAEEKALMVGSLLPVAFKLSDERSHKIRVLINKRFISSVNGYVLLANMSDERFNIVVNTLSRGESSLTVAIFKALGFADFVGGLDREVIFQHLVEIPPEGLESALYTIATCARGQNWSQEDYLKAIQLYKPKLASLSDFDPILETIFLGQKCYIERAEIKAKFSKVPPCQIAKYVNVFISLLGKHAWTGQEQLIVLERLLRTPAYKLRRVVEIAACFGTDARELAGYIDAFSPVSVLRMEHVANTLSGCDFDIKEAIPAFGKKPINSMTRTRDLCIQLCKYLNVEQSPAKVFKELAHYQIEGLEILAKVLPNQVTDLQLTEENIIRILQDLQSVKPDYIECVLSGAKRLTKNNSEMFYQLAVPALASIRPQFMLRESIDTALELRGEQQWKVRETINLIDGLAWVHESNREALIRTIKKYALENPNCDPLKLNNLVLFLKDMPRDRMESVLKTGLAITHSDVSQLFFKLGHGLDFLSDEALKTAEEICKHLNVSKLKNFQETTEPLLNIPDHLHELIRVDLAPLARYKVQFRTVCEVLPFLPETQIQHFLRAANESALGNRKSFKKAYSDFETILINHALVMGIAGNEPINELFDHWRNVLNSEDQEKSKRLSDFISEYAEDMGFPEIDELADLAQRVGIVLDEDGEDSPYNIYARLKDKRNEEIDWTKIPTLDKIVDNCNLRFRAQGVWELCKGMDPDYSKVPQISSQDFTNLLVELRAKCQNDEFKAKIDAKQNITTLINLALDPQSYLQRLLHTPQNHRLAAYLRYILKRYKDILDTDERATTLAQFLISVQGCNVGKSTAFEEIYFSLPNTYRLPFRCKEQKYPADSMKAFETLNDAVQKLSMEQLSEGSAFLKKVCQVDLDDDIHESAHQVKVLRGVLNDFVDCPGKLTFDLNAQLIYIPILESSLQDLLILYYADGDLEQMITSLRKKVNSVIKTSEDKTLYSHFSKLFNNDFECMKFDEDDKFKGVSQKGMIRLLKKANIVEEKERLF